MNLNSTVAASHTRPLEQHQQQILHGNSDGSCDFENVFSKMKLKYLRVDWEEDDGTCPVSKLVFRLLTEKTEEIVSLSLFDVTLPFASLLSAPNKLEFPRLREMEY